MFARCLVSRDFDDIIKEIEEENGRESEVELARSCKFVRIEKWPIDFSIDSRQIKGGAQNEVKTERVTIVRKFYL